MIGGKWGHHWIVEGHGSACHRDGHAQRRYCRSVAVVRAEVVRGHHRRLLLEQNTWAMTSFSSMIYMKNTDLISWWRDLGSSKRYHPLCLINKIVDRMI